MNEQEWCQNQLDEFMQNSHTYPQKALFFSLKQLLDEQYKRMEQTQGELDGKLWDTGNW